MPSLAALAEAAAAEVPDATAIAAGGTTTWSAGGRSFAVLSGALIEFRLEPVVGAAARRTPDTTASKRGEEWVAFAPAELDQYAEDRARAWFAAAYRRARG